SSGQHYVTMASGGDGKLGIAIFTAGSSEKKIVFVDKGRHVVAAQWSPLGDSILFSLAGCGKSRFKGFSYKTESPNIVLCAVQTLSSRRCSATCPRSNGFPPTIL